MLACIETERGPPCAAVGRHRRRVGAATALVESSPSSTFHTRKHSSHLHLYIYIYMYIQIISKKKKDLFISEFNSAAAQDFVSHLHSERRSNHITNNIRHIYI